MSSVKKYISSSIFLLAVGVFACKVINGTIKSNVLTEKSPEVKAVIINERNFFGNSPVSQEFSYSYLFKIDDKMYKGNSMESKFNIGDTILVRYLKSNPSINEPVGYYPK